MNRLILFSSLLLLSAALSFSQDFSKGWLQSGQNHNLGRNTSKQIQITDEFTVSVPAVRPQSLNRMSGKLALDSVISYRTDSVSLVITPTGKSYFSYDQNGSLTQYSYHAFCQDSSIWYELERSEYVNDAMGNHVSQHYYTSYHCAPLQPNFRMNSTYHPSGLLSSFAYESYNPQTQQWVKTDSAYFEWSAEGLLTLYEMYEWNDNQKLWVGTFRTEYTHNSAGQCTEIFTSIWSAGLATWHPSKKKQYAFDTSGRLLGVMEYHWSQMAWQNYYKIDFLHNAAGEIIEQTGYQWIVSSAQWVIRSQYQAAYDSTGRELSQFHSGWDDALQMLLPSYGYDWVYDTLNADYVKTYKFFNKQSMQWQFKWRNLFLLNPAHQIVQEIAEVWDTLSFEWAPKWKENFSYDGAGNPVETINYVFDTMKSTWELEGKLDQVFDSYGLEIFWQASVWDTLTKLWKNTERRQKALDYSQPATNLILPDWFDKYPPVMLLSEDFLRKDEASVFWFTDYRAEYFYSIPGSGIPALSGAKSGLLIYPNPADDYIILKLEQQCPDCVFMLFDLHGRKLIESVVANGRINTENISPGLYLYMVHAKNKIHQGKLVISR